MACDKTGYSKSAIESVKKAVYKRRKKKLRIYQCYKCYQWHLTSSVAKSEPWRSKHELIIRRFK